MLVSRLSPRLLLGATLVFVCFQLKAQYVPNHSIPVKKMNGNEYRFPWTGGFNNPQFSEADLNKDGINDLLVFDRSGDKVLTFINGGSPGIVDYDYDPSYEAGFPALKNWALLRDFNCDGIADLFTYTDGPMLDPQVGMQVYRGYFTADNRIAFENADSVLEYLTSSGDGDLNIFCSSVDLPSVADIDGDGDLDILTFQINGGYIAYYNNISIESGYECDSLIFKKSDDCWGDFYESGLATSLDLNVDCPFLTAPGEEAVRGTRHAGSTLLNFDNDGDGDQELILGDLSFSNLVYTTNCGTSSDAHVCEQDTLFPSYNEPADVFIFPAAFLADVDNNGLKDLLVSPNAEGGSENYEVVWRYLNTGNAVTALFDFQETDFMIADMIDVGEGSYAAWFDADLDGLQDIILGNRGFFDSDNINTYVGKLAYFRNSGSTASPEFTLVTEDYANVSSLNIKTVCPTFGDLDGDGDADMITGLEDGTLLFFKNIAAAGQAASFIFFSANYGGIDVGSASTPQLYDVDQDGLPDLVIGEQGGNLNYYRNTGTATAPAFQLESSFFGGVEVTAGSITGFSMPYLFDEGEGTKLYVGSERGTIYSYSGIDGNLSGTFVLEDAQLGGIKPGSRASVRGADVNYDGKVDLLVGNYRGGVTFYDSYITGTASPLPLFSWSVSVFPNPVSGPVQVVLQGNTGGGKAMLEVLDVFGNIVTSHTGLPVPGNLNLDMGRIAPGIYFMVFSTENTRLVRKIAVNQ